MLLHPLPALVSPFPRTFIIKGNFNNGKNSSSCPSRDIAFINEEATGCMNEAAIGASIVPRNLSSCFLFDALLFQSYHRLKDLIFLVPLQF